MHPHRRVQDTWSNSSQRASGATLDEPVKDGESLKINGSVMMAAADSPEEIMERLKNDVYAKEVWDLEKVQIIPVSQCCS